MEQKRVAINCPAQVPETIVKFDHIFLCVCFFLLCYITFSFFLLVVLSIFLCLYRFFCCCCWAQSEIHLIIFMAFVEQNMWFHFRFSTSWMKFIDWFVVFYCQFEKSLHILHLFHLVHCSVWLATRPYIQTYFTILLSCVAFVVRSIKNTNR